MTKRKRPQRKPSRACASATACRRRRAPLTARTMCARRFLTFIFVLVMLVVGAAFAFYQWGGSILLKEATPKGHFEAKAAGAGPDFALTSNWVARPDMPADSNPTHWLPAGFQPQPAVPRKA